MPVPRSLLQSMQIVPVLNPATDAAGRTGQYVSVKGGGKVLIAAHVNQGNAATVAVSLLQATAVGGTGSKALVATAISTNLDTVAAPDTYTSQAAASSFTTDAGVKNKIVLFEVDAAALDVTNGYAYVTISTGASNVANITEAMAYVYAERYMGGTMPTAVA